jgi:hypothetical protein
MRAFGIILPAEIQTSWKEESSAILFRHCSDSSVHSDTSEMVLPYLLECAGSANGGDVKYLHKYEAIQMMNWIQYACNLVRADEAAMLMGEIRAMNERIAAAPLEPGPVADVVGKGGRRWPLAVACLLLVVAVIACVVLAKRALNARDSNARAD